MERFRPLFTAPVLDASNSTVMMIQTSDSVVNMLAEDGFGITYYIENAQQFWSGTFRHSFHTLQLFVIRRNLLSPVVVFPFPLQNLTTSYVFRAMVRPHYPCLILHSGGLYPYVLLITVSTLSFYSSISLTISCQQNATFIVRYN